MQRTSLRGAKRCLVRSCDKYHLNDNDRVILHVQTVLYAEAKYHDS